MPRPDDFTLELQSFCDDEIRRYREQQRADPRSVRRNVPDDLFNDPALIETWYCGTWLDRKLTAAGLGREEVRSICYVNGHRLIPSADPWEVTRRTLENCLKKKGR